MIIMGVNNHMIKKFIVLFLLITFLGLDVSNAHHPDNHQPTTHVARLSTQLSALWKADQELKRSWTYQSLTIGKALYTSMESFTFFGFLGNFVSVMTQHNSPQILYALGRKIIPTPFQETYETLIAYAFGAAHLYQIATDPIKHAFGYASGCVGIFLMNHIIDDNIDDFYQKELKALAYFCCREAGWELHNNYRGHIRTFLQYIPQKIQDILFGEGDPIEVDSILLKNKLQEVDNMNDDVLVLNQQGEITPHLIPQCENPNFVELARLQFNSRVAPLLVSKWQKAQDESKNFIVFWGEDHTTCECHIQERQLFKLAKSLNITKVSFELGNKDMSESLREVEELKNFHHPIALLNPNNEKILLTTANIAHALSLNFTVIAGDPALDHAFPFWEAASEWYFGQLKALKRGKISKDAHFDISGYPLNFKSCPEFEKREILMAAKSRDMNENLVSIFGMTHLGGIHKFLGEMKNAILLFVTCADPEKDNGFLSRAFRYFQIRGRSKAFDQAFGEGCGARYEESLNEIYFYRSPSVVRSWSEEDREL